MQALIEEQHRIQIKGETNRCNALEMYSSEARFWEYWHRNKDKVSNPGELEDLGKRGFKKVLEDKLAEQEYVVWVDLGCGEAIALRQAKQHLIDIGYDPARLKAYGFDLLPVDEDEIRYHIENFPDGFDATLLDERCKPILEQKDIHTVDFPEKADIVTCKEVLFWTRDALQVFSNAARQTKIGGILAFNRTRHLLYFDDPTSCVFQDVVFQMLDRDGISGLKLLYNGSDSLLAEKSSEQDFTFGLQLHHKTKRGQDGFNYGYHFPIPF